MSPRKGPRRPVLSVRIDPDQQQWFDERAAADEIKPADLGRRIVEYARRHMPPGWLPIPPTTQEVEGEEA